MDNVEFDAIEKSSSSRYWLKGKYGPNNTGYWGQHAYIYLEIGGDEIVDGAIVTTWATVLRPEEIISQTDPFGNVTTMTYKTGLPYVQTEIAECAVIYRQDRPEGGQVTDAIVNIGGEPTEITYHYAEPGSIDVRTYRGKILKNGDWELTTEVPNVWSVPISTSGRYPQGHAVNNWDHISFCGCYM